MTAQMTARGIEKTIQVVKILGGLRLEPMKYMHIKHAVLVVVVYRIKWILQEKHLKY